MMSITCKKYMHKPGSKRCVSYLPGGACSKSDNIMCTEWLKANGKPEKSDTPKYKQEDGFLKPSQITNEHIESFKAMKKRFIFKIPGGKVCLVPEYTNKHENEISVDDLVTMMKIAEVFPETQLLSMERITDGRI